MSAAAAPAALSALSAPHRRRLRELWRSAGWPCRDALELDLLAAGLLQRHWDGDGRETLRVTDAGLAALSAARDRARAALDPHEALVARVAQAMHRAGRVVWRGLSMRAPLPVDTLATHGVAAASDALPGFDGAADVPGVRWVLARPDVFSIRRTSREAALEPVVHEIKVSRSDLLADLHRPDKARAYRALAGEVWYVMRAGLARPEEIPDDYGCMEAFDDGRLEVVRPAPRRRWTPGFAWWMALAQATPEPGPPDEPGQAALAPVDG